MLSNYTPCYDKYNVQIVDESLSKVEGTGSTAISVKPGDERGAWRRQTTKGFLQG